MAFVRNQTTALPPLKEIVVIDPTSKYGKHYVPLTETYETRGRTEWIKSNGKLKKDLSICCLFQKGKCHAAERCHQVHVERQYVIDLRRQYGDLMTCCRLDGDVHSEGEWYSRFFRNTFPSGTVCVSFPGQDEANAVEIDALRLAYTVGLDEALEGGLVRRRDSAQGPAIFSYTKVCRLHMRDACKYGKDCKNLHFCHKIAAQLDPENQHRRATRCMQPAALNVSDSGSSRCPTPEIRSRCTTPVSRRTSSVCSADTTPTMMCTPIDHCELPATTVHSRNTTPPPMRVEVPTTSAFSAVAKNPYGTNPYACDYVNGVPVSPVHSKSHNATINSINSNNTSRQLAFDAPAPVNLAAAPASRPFSFGAAPAAATTNDSIWGAPASAEPAVGLSAFAQQPQLDFLSTFQSEWQGVGGSSSISKPKEEQGAKMSEESFRAIFGSAL